MKEIKFRAWHNEEERMLTIAAIDWDDNFVAHKEGIEVSVPGGWNETHHVSSLDDVELMQYTLGKDCNGKEIYEGDILAISSEYCEPVTDDGNGPDYEYNQLKVVLHSALGFGVEMQNDNCFSERFYPLGEILAECDEVMIMGNIYENPEIFE